jgi:catechol 2,3-dioxygenase-like lactoylglutathione lyase family enzyme
VNATAGLTAPRWTHIALPSIDLDRSIAWYEEFTPLVLLQRFEDAMGQSAWLSHAGQVDNPFVLVLVMFYKDQGKAQPQLAPFAHIGIEVPTRAELDAIAERARAAGCLAMEPVDLPPPVGYVCMIADPDGNRIEISHDQAVYATVQEKWGSGT